MCPMSLGDKLRSWISQPIATIPSFQCADCGIAVTMHDTECPECGGEIEQIGIETIPTEWY